MISSIYLLQTLGSHFIKAQKVIHNKPAKKIKWNLKKYSSVVPQKRLKKERKCNKEQISNIETNSKMVGLNPTGSI